MRAWGRLRPRFAPPPDAEEEEEEEEEGSKESATERLRPPLGGLGEEEKARKMREKESASGPVPTFAKHPKSVV